MYLSNLSSETTRAIANYQSAIMSNRLEQHAFIREEVLITLIGRGSIAELEALARRHHRVDTGYAMTSGQRRRRSFELHVFAFRRHWGALLIQECNRRRLARARCRREWWKRHNYITSRRSVGYEESSDELSSDEGFSDEEFLEFFNDKSSNEESDDEYLNEDYGRLRLRGG